jgi:hypothetical protein
VPARLIEELDRSWLKRRQALANRFGKSHDSFTSTYRARNSAWPMTNRNISPVNP